MLGKEVSKWDHQSDKIYLKWALLHYFQQRFHIPLSPQQQIILAQTLSEKIYSQWRVQEPPGGTNPIFYTVHEKNNESKEQLVYRGFPVNLPVTLMGMEK